ncbi:response regulator transcription factor [Facklamia lactis]|uniref:response regulator transcription factor n=1 Tax=Facklamia lactis TaxID=2749967 RepID=UPI0018CF0D57|nr:response regulator transcription factor [Facklamia lactis]MBG9979736.1 response regulator transcription factor [Facklamia lactis]
MSQNILIVEDDLTLLKGLEIALHDEGLFFQTASTLQKARVILNYTDIDLLILDVNLPDGDGLNFLTEIRKTHKQMAIIMLTARDLEIDIVTGLELGANDYITKPFSLAVLKARVHNQLRTQFQAESHIYQSRNYYFDFDQSIFQVSNEMIYLSKTEERLLRYLVEHRNSVLQRDQLIDYLWFDSNKEYIEENSLSVVIKRLRNKLGIEHSIKTVYGIGYQWKEK